MCNIILSLVFLVANPDVRKFVSKMFTGAVNLVAGIFNWLSTVSDKKAHEIVSQMLEEGFDPSKARERYMMIRFGILALMVFGPIFLCSLLSVIG